MRFGSILMVSNSETKEPAHITLIAEAWGNGKPTGCSSHRGWGILWINLCTVMAWMQLVLIEAPVSAPSWRRRGSPSLTGTTACCWRRWPASWGPGDRLTAETTTHTGGNWGPEPPGRTWSAWLQGLSRRVAHETEWSISGAHAREWPFSLWSMFYLRLGFTQEGLGQVESAWVSGTSWAS